MPVELVNLLPGIVSSSLAYVSSPRRELRQTPVAPFINAASL